MVKDNRILAVVPARSGSKGIPGKNLQKIGGLSLIALAGRCLEQCPGIDRKIISTDSPEYAREAEAHGLDVPFLRPPELSGDQAGAVETMQHAWKETEARYGEQFDLMLIIEPTCPLRRPEDILGCLALMNDPAVESVVSVSRVDTKFHPAKILDLDSGRLKFYLAEGAAVKSRQGLRPYYYRNGACYALRRHLLLEEGRIFGEHTLPYVMERPLANIDEDFDLELARWLWQDDTI